MARKKVREYVAKELFRKHLKNLEKYYIRPSVQINMETDLDKLAVENPWLLTDKLVVKPDMLFGKRGKGGFVKRDIDFPKLKSMMNEKLGAMTTVGEGDSAVTGRVTHFICEPYLPDIEEYYLSVALKRTGDHVMFCHKGGIYIEDNWDKAYRMDVSPLDDVDEEMFKPLLKQVPEVRIPYLAKFIAACVELCRSLHVTLLEMNPLVILPNDVICPLDMRMVVDDCARSVKPWGDTDPEMPPSFGKDPSPEESYIESLDEVSGASLKLTILNRKGRVWTMVAGGGASVIYADTVCDLNLGKALGNYGEYSGGPSEKETYKYAKTLFKLAAHKEESHEKRALIIGGGIANFTDVLATFSGIITALEEDAKLLKDANVRVWVRRGGPNYVKGLKLIGEKLLELGLIDSRKDVTGPEKNMTTCVKEAVTWIGPISEK